MFSKNKSIIEQKISESHIEELSNKGIIDIKNCEKETFALTFDGKLYSWGYNKFEYSRNVRPDDEVYKPKLNKYLRDKNIIELSCSKSHLLVLTNDGKVYSFGNNEKGQVGNRKSGKDEYKFIPYFINEFNGAKIKSISCGSYHSLALTRSGRVYSWGYNSCGQLGRKINKWKIFNFINNKKFHSSCPKAIELNKDIIIEKISCGKSHSLLLSHEGEIYGFGSNKSGELGVNSDCDELLFPIKLNDYQKFTEIASYWKYDFSCALSINGLYYIWGKVSEEEITRELKETQFKSFNEIFINYFGITFKPEKEKIFGFNDNIIRSEFHKNEFFDNELLGAGSYGEVYKVKKLSSFNEFQYFAIKKIEFSDDLKDINMLSKELENFSIIKGLSLFVVQYYDLWFEKSKNSKRLFAFIQMELCDQSLKDLMNEIKNDSKLFNNNSLTLLGYYFLSELFIQILECVRYLHEQNPQIIHRDLKPDNILLIINYYNNNIVKIADMGLICLHNKEKEFNTSIRQYHTQDIGPLIYAAPEVLDGRIYDTRSDIYSLGIVLQELFLINDNNRNFMENNETSLLINKYYELRELWKKMTKIQADNRPKSCEEILNYKNLWTLNVNDFNVNELEDFCDNFDEDYKDSYMFNLMIKLLAPSLHYSICDQCNVKTVVHIRQKYIGNELKPYSICDSCIKKFYNQSESNYFSNYNICEECNVNNVIDIKILENRGQYYFMTCDSCIKKYYDQSELHRF